MQSSTIWNPTRPLIIAHRGACRLAPENTLPAYRRAADVGADAIEIDAKLTSDGHVVVIHDQTLDRTTSGSGRVAEHTLEELKALDAGSHFSQEFAGERIPTLEEVLDAFGSKMLINVELSNYASPGDDLPMRVVELVRRFGLEGRVLLSSFNPLALMRARRFAAHLPRGLLLMPREPSWIRRAFAWLAPHDALHLQEQLIYPGFPARKVRAKRKLVVWTVNDLGRIRELVRMGIDGLITDVPDVGKQAVNDVLPGH